MRRAPHEGQKPRRLQLKATSLSWPQSAQRSLRKPLARMPHSRKASNSSLTNGGPGGGARSGQGRHPAPAALHRAAGQWLARRTPEVVSPHGLKPCAAPQSPSVPLPMCALWRGPQRAPVCGSDRRLRGGEICARPQQQARCAEVRSPHSSGPFSVAAPAECVRWSLQPEHAWTPPDPDAVRCRSPGLGAASRLASVEQRHVSGFGGSAAPAVSPAFNLRSSVEAARLPAPMLNTSAINAPNCGSSTATFSRLDTDAARGTRSPRNSASACSRVMPPG